MGCCFSSEAVTQNHRNPFPGKSLPPYSDAETVVKEVLSGENPQIDLRDVTDSPPPKFHVFHKLPPTRSDDPVAVSDIPADDDVSGRECDFCRAGGSPAKLRRPRYLFSEVGETEGVVGKSPIRKFSDRSPCRENRDGGEAGRAATVTRLRSDRSSLGRSRSPGLKSKIEPDKFTNVGRVSPGKRVNRSPGRVRRSSPESCGVKESLENPVVSMECFIFL